MTYDRTLLARMWDWKRLHVPFCWVCRGGSACLDRALYDAGRADLIELDDDGYSALPHYVRVRAADKLGLTWKSTSLVGATIRWAVAGEVIGTTGPIKDAPS